MNSHRVRYKAGSICCLLLASLAFAGMIVASVFAAKPNSGISPTAPIVGVVGSLILVMIFGAFGALQAIAVRQYDKRKAANAAAPQPLPVIPAPSLGEATRAITASIARMTKKIHIRAVCTQPGCPDCFSEMNEPAFPEVVSTTAANTVVIA